MYAYPLGHCRVIGSVNLDCSTASIWYVHLCQSGMGIRGDNGYVYQCDNLVLCTHSLHLVRVSGVSIWYVHPLSAWYAYPVC